MKKLIFGMLVVGLGIGGSLVSSKANPLFKGSDLVPNWFKFQGGDPNDPANYVAVEALPECCIGGENVCAVLAEPNALDPDKPRLETVTDLAFEP